MRSWETCLGFRCTMGAAGSYMPSNQKGCKAQIFLIPVHKSSCAVLHGDRCFCCM